MFRNLSESIKKAKKLNLPLAEKMGMLYRIYTWNSKKNKNKIRESIVTEDFLNFKFSSYNYWTIDYLFEEIFLEQEYFFETSEDSPIILDCGANIGMSVLYFKWLYPNSRIMAFEPNPNSFKLLEKNILENVLKDVEYFNIGLFDKEAKIPFYIDNNLSTLIGSINPERGGNRKLEVPAEKLSQYIDAFGEVDLVKMDVEGAEENILNDLVESGSLGKVKEYIIEYHHNLGPANSSLSNFLKEFEKHGYSYNLGANFKRTHAFQDIKIHFYKC